MFLFLTGQFYIKYDKAHQEILQFSFACRPLFFRLNIFPLVIPPLRKRKEDIEIIASYFLDQFSQETGKQIKGFTKQAVNFMISNPWQGNVRESKNSIERAVILCEKTMITEDDLIYDKYGAKQKHTDMAISVPP